MKTLLLGSTFSSATERAAVRGLLAGSFLLLASSAWAAPIVKTVGVGGNYSTINAALASITGTPTDPVSIELLDVSYSENVRITQAGTAINPITIRPAAGVSTVIEGTLTFDAGSRYVTVSGNNGTVNRALTLKQTDDLATTVLFQNDAQNNAVVDAQLLGSCRQPGFGVVTIGNAASGGNGNDHNTLRGNRIGNASGTLLPSTLIYALNLRNGIANDAVTIVDNELVNFERNGLQVLGGNGFNWNVSNNSIYYDAAIVPTAAQTAIDFEPGTASTNNTISGNKIGGRNSLNGGGSWLNDGASFRGIVVTCGMGVSSTLSGNSVSNVSMTNTFQPLTAMSLESGQTAVAGISVMNVSSGQGGVVSLNSGAATEITNFTVASGQIVNVETGGRLNVTGTLRNNGLLKNAGNVLIVGDFVNTNTGTYNQTQGTLEVTGNMTSQGGLFTSVGGLVKLTGNGTQTVSGGVYFNLEVNGLGTKTITADADIISQLTLANGVLATGAHTLKLLEQASMTETATSYVLGKVLATRNVQAATTQRFGGIGLEMTPNSGSVLPGTTDVLRVTGTAPIAANGNQGILRYYDINAATSSGLDLSLKLSYLNHELNGIAPANLRFFKSVDGGVNWMPRGITSNGAGYAQLDNVDGFSRWTLGDAQRPLPVGITAFRAVRRDRQSLVTWTTATETNNRGFGVEVSADGRQFRPLGFVPAQEGSSTAVRSYQFVDQEDNKKGVRYYRLRQEDRDGRTTYFGPVTVSFDQALAAQFAAYPTAFTGNLTVELTAAASAPAAFTLTDALGRVVWQHTQMVAAGFNQTQLTPECPAGNYILTAKLNGTVLRQRVVRQ
jgi:hypothetical protein